MSTKQLIREQPLILPKAGIVVIQSSPMTSAILVALNELHEYYKDPVQLHETETQEMSGAKIAYSPLCLHPK